MLVGGVGNGVGVWVIVGVTGCVAVDVESPNVAVTGTREGVGVSVEARRITSC
jgi:hypothetical protein